MNIIGAYGNFNQERKIGEYTIYLPDPPNLRDIKNRDLSVSSQRWRREGFNLKHFLSWPLKARKQFVTEQWNKRNKGEWWFNGGNLEYATGTHWFYMEHWFLENIYPNFVDRDRDFFYLWKFGVEDDENCTGLQLIGKRRDGKTHRGNVIVYDRSSAASQAMGGIQSKTDADAKKVFNKLIRAWKRVPFYFRPVDEGDDHPKSALRFYAPKSIDRKGDQKMREHRLALESEINFEGVTDEAYDGTKLIVFFSDEYGKVIKGNVHARSQVTNECMVVGTTVSGKQIWTTTVEEMVKKGGVNAKKVWDESDPEQLTENKRTINGMKRLFVAASVGMEGNDPLDGKPFVDEFGYSQIAKAEAYIQREYSSRRGETKRSYRRKYPLKVSDAFLVESDGGHFDEEKIDDQLEYLPTWTGKLREGEFKWTGEPFKSPVAWKEKDVEKPFFRALMFMDNDQLGPSNNIGYDEDGLPMPRNTKEIVAGTDPFDHKKTAENKNSSAAAYFFIKHNPLNPNNTGLIAMEYYGRRPTPNKYYEDTLMACIYFGCQINPENTKSGIINFFDDKGFGHFIMKRPDSTIDPNAKGRGGDTDGTPSNTEFVINRHLESMIQYVDAYCHMIYYKELLEELLRFNVTDRTLYDRVMAFGYTLLAALAKKHFNYEEQAVDINNYYEELNNSVGDDDLTSTAYQVEY